MCSFLRIDYTHHIHLTRSGARVLPRVNHRCLHLRPATARFVLLRLESIRPEAGGLSVRARLLMLAAVVSSNLDKKGLSNRVELALHVQQRKQAE
jgi:hypothetical protein